VRPGDSYWTISRLQYGSGRYHAALLEFNRASLPEAERIHPGMQLQIPPVELLESRYPELVQGVPAPAASSPAASPLEDEAGRFFISAEGQPMYRVGKGDTLTSIAQRHLGRASRWEQIARMNPDVVPHPDRLKVGVTLRLPPDASQVAESPVP
jgi:nucleoid-associated protein YgaU